MADKEEASSTFTKTLNEYGRNKISEQTLKASTASKLVLIEAS